jgi:hypothetical protein
MNPLTLNPFKGLNKVFGLSHKVLTLDKSYVVNT